MDLKNKVKSLPNSPGVYLMKDSSGSIIYVGKSKNLKQRVQSYFSNSKSHSSKVEKLVKNLKDFEYILLDTEFEAFMLECRLIKDIKPIYNKKMKSPLSYTYIRIETAAELFKIELYTNHSAGDTGLFFGPYTSKGTAEKALEGLKLHCKINCSNPSRRNSMCLNYSLGQCIGMCGGGPAADLYKAIIKRIIGLLKGTDRSLLEEMEQTMLLASERFDFETAAKYRDYIDAINALVNREKVIEFTEQNNNIVMLEKLPEGMAKLFLINRNKVLYSENYKLEGSNAKQLTPLIKERILTFFKPFETFPYSEVDRDEIDEAQIIYSYLKYSKSNYFVIPEEWLTTADQTALDKALNSLLTDDR